MKFKGKDPKVWITTDNFLSFLLHPLSKSWARISTLWKVPKEEQKWAAGDTAVHWAHWWAWARPDWCWLQMVEWDPSLRESVVFLSMLQGDSRAMSLSLSTFCSSWKNMKPDNCFAQTIQKSRRLLLHPSALCISLLFDLMNQCTCLSTSNSDKVAS